DGLEPMIEPSQVLAAGIDARAWEGCLLLGVIMSPWTDEHLPRRRQLLERPQFRAGVPIGPTLDQQYRALHAVIARRQALIAPIRTVQRVANIVEAPWLAALQPFGPDRGETIAHQSRIGRREIQRIHHRRIAFEHPGP